MMKPKRNGTAAMFARSLIAAVVFLAAANTVSGQLPDRDTRHEKLGDADHFILRREPVGTPARWEARRDELQTSLLLRAGLIPEPERCPLNARVFDEREGDGFIVAKVHFESLPGFHATGNLYRPASGGGPFPAIVTPHGHWTYGRLQNSPQGSIPGRCIDFARMGFVVFSIDMVGYNDSFQFPHDPSKSRAQLRADEPVPYEPNAFRGNFRFPEMELYGFNLGGVQLWNAIRAVDFLESLPYVDRDRIGATGASGGASQTIFLMAADDRIKAAAPVNIIGAAKHPGCYCENIPGLWIDTSTIELSAAFAPRPLLLMSATEDPWTPMTPEREYPMFREYYALHDAVDNVMNVHIDAGHNYNADTRAAVYRFFCDRLNPSADPIENPPPVSPELKKLGDLRVLPDHILPDGSLDHRAIMRTWREESERAIGERFPDSAGKLAAFRDEYRPLLASVLAVKIPAPDAVLERPGKSVNVDGAVYETVSIGRRGRGDAVELEIISPRTVTRGVCLVVRPESRGSLITRTGGLDALARELMAKGYRVARLRGYASGRLRIPRRIYDSFSWSWVYNRDNTLNGIQDIVTALHYLGKTRPDEDITLAGLEQCGLPALMAAAVTPSTASVIVDMNRTDPGYDGELVNLLPYGAIRRIGDVRTAAILLMDRPLVMYNAGETFDAGWYRERARSVGCAENVAVRRHAEDVSVVEFVR